MSINRFSPPLPVLTRVILFYLFSIIIFATISGIFKGLSHSDQLSLLFTSILTFILAYIFAKWEKLSLREIGIGFQYKSLLKFLSGFGIGVLMVSIQALITSNFAEVTFLPSPNVSVVSIGSAFTLYFLVAVREELVFRSYLLRSLAKAINPIFALCMMTGIFIVEHIIAGMSWKFAIIGSGLGAILFGLAALKSKGLALPIGIHFSWNFTQWILGFKNNNGVWREVITKGNEGYAENIALIGFIIAMTTGITGILLYYKKYNKLNSSL